MFGVRAGDERICGSSLSRLRVSQCFYSQHTLSQRTPHTFHAYAGTHRWRILAHDHLIVTTRAPEKNDAIRGANRRWFGYTRASSSLVAVAKPINTTPPRHKLSFARLWPTWPTLAQQMDAKHLRQFD